MSEEFEEEQVPAARGTGWALDGPGKWTRFTANALFGAPTSLPSDHSLEEFAGTPNDQTITNSCVGQAIAKGLTVRLRAMGRQAPEFSAFSIYTPARRFDQVLRNVRLEDAGCRPSNAFRSIKVVGVALDETWPFDSSKVNSPLPLDVIQDAMKFQVFDWWRITSEGENRSTAVAQAISKGFPVAFGIALWEAFFDFSSALPIAEIEGEDRGGHMMLVVGYYTLANGKRVFRVLNSWGKSWGDSGLCWIHEDVLALDRASDFYVLQVS